MRISWYGQGCFQIITKEREQPQVSIITDPFSQGFNLKAPWKKADVLLLSQRTKEGKDIKAKPQPFLIDGPGEYEIKNIFIQGIKTGPEDEKRQQKITIFTILSERLKVCFLGTFFQKEFSTKELDRIGDVDILIVPTGGVDTISSKQAQKIISQIEPRVVIPMHYKIPGLNKKKETLKDFLKTFGAESVEAQNVLSIKESDLPKENGEIKVFVLKP